MRKKLVDISDLITPAQAGVLINRNRSPIYTLIANNYIRHEIIGEIPFVYAEDILRWERAEDFKMRDLAILQHLSIKEASKFMACSITHLKNQASMYGAFLEDGALRFDKDILRSKSS